MGVPSTGIPLVELIKEVTKMYNTLKCSTPITIHCSSGVGRTGVFIALSIIMERIKREGVIDVFQTVKMLRIQRVAMVQTLVRKWLTVQTLLYCLKYYWLTLIGMYGDDSVLFVSLICRNSTVCV